MMMEKDILYDFHNYGTNISSREIFLHNHYGSNDEENPGVEYKMSNTFIKNLRALDAKSSDHITVHMHSVGGEWFRNDSNTDSYCWRKCAVSNWRFGK